MVWCLFLLSNGNVSGHRYWNQVNSFLIWSLLFLCESTIKLYSLYLISQFSSVAQLCPTLQPHGLQHARPPCPSPTPEAYSNSCPLSHWCHLICCCSLLFLPSIFSSIRVFSRVSSSHQETKVLEFQLQHQSFQWIFRTDFLQDWLVGSPCSPRDS